MSSTFLELTNKLLHRLNEVELTVSSFPSARGLHASAKDFIIDAVDEINSKEFQWPFNASTGSQVCVVGQELYDFNALTLSVDWQSFRIEKDDTLDVYTTPLRLINQDEWYQYGQPRDDDTGAEGRDIPRFVFEAHGNKFGVTPSPDKTYNILYNRFTLPERMVDYDDTTTIPVYFDHVITDHALVYFNMHKDNAEQTQLAESRASRSLSNMRAMLLDKQDYMTDTRVRFSGTNWRQNYHV
jgi:hypothetical protein